MVVGSLRHLIKEREKVSGHHSLIDSGKILIILIPHIIEGAEL